MITYENFGDCAHCEYNPNFKKYAVSSCSVSTRACSRDEEWAYKQLYGDLFYEVEHYNKARINVGVGND